MAGPGIFEAVLQGITTGLANELIHEKKNPPASPGGPGLPFDVPAGAEGLASSARRNVSRIDYRLGRLGGIQEQLYANIEGSFIYVDPVLSIGAVRLSVGATQAGAELDQITLWPGQSYNGEFKGVSLSALDHAAGQLLFGRGAIGSSPGDLYRGRQVFLTDRVSSIVDSGSYAVGFGNNLTAPGTSAQLVGIRNLQATITETLAGAQVPIPTTTQARITGGAGSSTASQGELVGFNFSLDGAGNWVKESRYQFSDIAYKDEAGIMAGTVLLIIDISTHDASVITAGGVIVNYNRFLFA